jgi:hypothetical protein
MTKAAICVHCWDIVSPRRDWRIDRSWRWCECDHMAVRWRDGGRGLLEVSACHGPESVRVIGINNQFLESAILGHPEGRGYTADEWRDLHRESCEAVDPYYLFHADNRACWALVVRVGESGDVTFVPYPDANRMRFDEKEISA